MEENCISTSAILLENIYSVFSSCWTWARPQSLLLSLPKKRKKRKTHGKFAMELTRDKAESHSWQWYMAFLINNISKSYFPLEIHIKEGSKMVGIFLVTGSKWRGTFICPIQRWFSNFSVYLSTNPFIHPFIYPWIYVFMNLCISLFSLFLY